MHRRMGLWFAITGLLVKSAITFALLLAIKALDTQRLAQRHKCLNSTCAQEVGYGLAPIKYHHQNALHVGLNHGKTVPVSNLHMKSK